MIVIHFLEVKYSRTKKQASIPALEAWPEGKEYKSTETVTNMSISLCFGRERRNVSFSITMTMRSSTNPAMGKILSKWQSPPQLNLSVIVDYQ